MFKVSLPTMAQKVGIYHKKVKKKKNPTQFKAHFLLAGRACLITITLSLFSSPMAVDTDRIH